jgi:hypothetical protein
MEEKDFLSYVESALPLQGFKFDEATTQEIALQFSKIHDIAATFIEMELPVSLESASVFRP